jgi:2-methylisocitrate lyase-like PEP mutase family enzyme
MDKPAALRATQDGRGPLITPLGHDAFSARLIAAAGFPAFNIGGSALLAARYALPDLGLAALGEMTAAMREVVEAVDIPCMADADDGYGDLKGVARTVQAYERMGVAGLLLEDQVLSGKQPGASAARAVIPVEDHVAKIRTALDTRDTGLVVVGRTDALGLEGLDGALRRGERYLEAGADAVFVAGLKTEAQYEAVGKAFKGNWLLAALFETGGTPWLSPKDLYGLGFTQISYPMLLMQRIAGLLEETLASLRAYAGGELPAPAHQGFLSPEGFRKAVALDRWLDIEKGNP